MTGSDILDHVLKDLDEVIFPALAAYVVFLLRSWLLKQKTPPRAK